MAAQNERPERRVAGESLIGMVDFLECPICFEPIGSKQILDPYYFVTDVQNRK